MRVVTCVNHISKPASKRCKICGDGLCKYCKTRQTTNYAGDWDGVVCEKCDKGDVKSSKIL